MVSVPNISHTMVASLCGQSGYTSWRRWGFALSTDLDGEAGGRWEVHDRQRTKVQRGNALGKAVSEWLDLLLREPVVKGTLGPFALQPRTCQPHLCDFALNLPQRLLFGLFPAALPHPSFWKKCSLYLHPDRLSQKGWGGPSNQDVNSLSTGVLMMLEFEKA